MILEQSEKETYIEGDYEKLSITASSTQQALKFFQDYTLCYTMYRSNWKSDQKVSGLTASSLTPG